MFAEGPEYDSAVSLLGQGDYLRLRKAAKRWLDGHPEGDLREVVSDAIAAGRLAAAGQGGRRWRRDQPFMEYLITAVDGIARKAAYRRGPPPAGAPR
jgi:hypothetical protein